MEIESLRLDFQPLLSQNPRTIAEHIREGKKKKKNQKNPGSVRDLGRVLPGSRDPGSAPRPSLPPTSSGFLFGCSENHKVWIS